MPSLASEESPTGGRGLQRHSEWQRTVEPTTPSIESLPSSEQTAVNALLMAARAMPERMDHQDRTRAEMFEFQTPPMLNGTESDGTPDDSLRTAQRNLLCKFTSPKRKADHTVDTRGNPSSHIQANRPRGPSKSEEIRVNNSDETAQDSTQLAKRSRLGSLGMDINEDGRFDVKRDKDDMVVSTPAKCSSSCLSTTTEWTPVSARCIDFKHMRVSERNGSPASS
jgi:hypothetical protein